MQTATHWGAYRVETEQGRLRAIEPLEGDPDPSPIGRSMLHAVDAACRIRRPAVRLGYLQRDRVPDARARGCEPFVEVEWDRALDLAAGALERIRREHGNPSVFGGSYGWSSAGRFHHAQSHVHRFLNCLGGYTSSVNTYSVAAAEVITPHVVGPLYPLMAQMSPWSVIAAHTQLFVSFGGIPLKNTQVNSGGVSRHETRGWLDTCRRGGVEFVNVSPIRDDLAEPPGARWLAARPNTDVAIMLALAHTLWTEQRCDREFLDSHCVGFERFLPYLLGESDGQPKDARWAAPICGLQAGDLLHLARSMSSRRTLINVSWSVQRADHGEQPYWMAVVLAAMLGGIGKPGEGFGFGYGAVARIGGSSRESARPTLPQGRNAVETFIPVARLTDMLMHPGEVFDYNGRALRYPNIELIYWAGGNPFHHQQDLNRLAAAWRRPDTIIVHEQFWNAHARRADIVLPATTALEREDIGAAAGDNRLLVMHRCIEPVGEARDDFEIFRALAQRLGVEPDYTENRDARQWIESLYERCRERNRTAGIDLPEFATFWRAGAAELPEPAVPAIFLQDFRLDPQLHPLPTPSGRIEIFSARIAGFGYPDCPGHPVWLEPYEWLGSALATRYPLHLISNQPATRLHSQLDHGCTSAASKVQGREPLRMHPLDAAERGLTDGEIVRVFNDRGACLAGLVLSECLRRGVVQLATGAWYCPLDPAEPGSIDVHGNPNVLTCDRGSSRLAQAPTAQTTLVEVRRWEGTAPPVNIFEPPA